MSTVRTDLPRNLYRIEQLQELDRIAIEDKNIPGITLMERAGQAAFEVLSSFWPLAKNIVVLCGGGNNGGDGYIVARLVREAGLSCELMTMANDRPQGDAGLAADRWLAAGGKSSAFSGSEIGKADVIVDALFGIGLDREIRDEYRNVIDTVNTSAKPVLALDVPSGLHADSGMILGCAIRADVTITFIGLKQGMFTGYGPGQTGSILYSDLGIPQEVYQGLPPAAKRLDDPLLDKLLTVRARNSHKGDYGHVLAIGGDYGFAGAVRMAAEAAARCGAGLVSLATRPEHALSIPLLRPELMSQAVVSYQDLNPLLEKASVVVIGPGLGQSDWSQSLLARVLETRLPLVVDADALNLLALDPANSARWILTPHPGEAARLLMTTTNEIQIDRYAAARGLQQKYGGVIVLKGCGTIIADDAGLSVCDAGNPGMASGGMGDVLSGVIAGLVAQGLRMNDAAKLGVYVHARAADEAAMSGERGMLATDLMPFIRTLVNS